MRNSRERPTSSRRWCLRNGCRVPGPNRRQKNCGFWRWPRHAVWDRRVSGYGRFWNHSARVRRTQVEFFLGGRGSMKLIEGFDSNYRYILVAARRARQLQGGAPPVIETISRKPCRIAQDEIRAGKVKWLIPELPKTAVDSATEALDKAFLPDA